MITVLSLLVSRVAEIIEPVRPGEDLKPEPGHPHCALPACHSGGGVVDEILTVIFMLVIAVVVLAFVYALAAAAWQRLTGTSTKTSTPSSTTPGR
jgi:hypothetical protein